jgi:hypothetical protein
MLLSTWNWLELRSRCWGFLSTDIKHARNPQSCRLLHIYCIVWHGWIRSSSVIVVVARALRMYVARADIYYRCMYEKLVDI